MKKIHLLVFSIALIFSACKKYEEGPAISLRTKMQRVSNTWRIDKVFETPQNGSKTEKTTDYKNYYVDYNMVIDQERHYSISYKPLNFGTYNETGTWHFNVQKTNIVFVNGNGNSSSIGTVWTILRLKEKELWMQTENGNNVTIEAHFIPN